VTVLAAGGGGWNVLYKGNVRAPRNG